MISPAELGWFRQDTAGPICRTVSVAVEVLDVIVAFDKRDKATRTASKYIPRGGYKQFLNSNWFKGKRLGLARNPFFMFESGSVLPQVFEHHFHTLRQGGAILVDHLEIAKIDVILSFSEEDAALEAEFKISVTPVRTLADVIAFNNKFHLEKIKEYGEDILLRAEATNGINKKTLFKLARLSKNGFEKLMKEHDVSPFLAIGGFPGISVLSGYDNEGIPFGICFGGLKGFEPKLIEIAYSFKQATKIRKPPSFKP